MADKAGSRAILQGRGLTGLTGLAGLTGLTGLTALTRLTGLIWLTGLILPTIAYIDGKSEIISIISIIDHDEHYRAPVRSPDGAKKILKLEEKN